MCLDGYSFQKMSLKCCYCTASELRAERGSTGPAGCTAVLLCAPVISPILIILRCPDRNFYSPTHGSVLSCYQDVFH